MTIDSLTILTSSLAKPGALPTGIAIALRNTIGTAIERCVLAQLGAVTGRTTARRGRRSTSTPATTTGFASGPQAAGAPLIALDGFVVETLVDDERPDRDDRDRLRLGSAYTASSASTAMAIGLDERLRSSAAETAARGSGYVLTYDLAVEDNLFVCFLTGVSLEGFTVNVGDTRDRAGTRCSAASGPGSSVNGLTLPLMSRVDVVGNMLAGLRLRDRASPPTTRASPTTTCSG